MVRTFLAEGGVVGSAKSRREPDPPFLVEHAVVVISFGIPDFLRAPVRRRLHELVACRMARSERLRSVCIPYRRHDVHGGMFDWIKNRNQVGTVFGGAI